MSSRGFLNEMLHKYNIQQVEVMNVFYSLWLLTNYKTIKSGHLLFRYTFSIFFYDYYVATLEIIHPITLLYKAPTVKVL